ncbi:MAG TPA: hypothetical protein PK096_01395 [Candidatus Saccharibacteria bacterium]|nr:hypothetical protein [Candidatus Saccharibacteria bacterium]HRK94004.1 hypothetical protein [Candidatus Saccharibacteria bacterium]
MLATSIFVASFAYLFATSTPVYAADANWDGDNIAYDGETYKPTDISGASGVNKIPNGAQVYQYESLGPTPKTVKLIYFDDGITPKSAKEATYIEYTLNPPNRYSDPSGEKTITLTPADPLEGADTDDGAVTDTCTIDGIGWLVCPIMYGVSEGMDFIYERVQGFLLVQPITNSVDNPIYRVWVYSRDIANILFVIGFLVIIYSYLAGGGFSGYEIRKIIPRIIIAAILVNVSYIICSAAVDASNIAGHSVNQLFENVRDNVVSGSSAGDDADVNWTSVTTWVLAGSGGAIAGALVLPGAIGGLGGLWMMLATFLFGAALVIIVTFLILAARQAIIIVLIAVAPLAFAAYILPNTEKWFGRWRDIFVNMLVMFPAFAAVFGGAQLAGEVIIRTATSIEQIILGLGVMVTPLAITPLLLKLGGGVLNRIGGIVNDRQKGLFDRVKNHNEERRKDFIARNNALNAERRQTGNFGGRNWTPRTLVRQRAAANYARKQYRETQRKEDESAAENYWHNQTGRWGYDNHGTRDTRSRFGWRQDGHGNLDTYKRDNQMLHDQTEAHHEEHWQNLVQGDATRRGMLTDTRLAQGRSKITEEAMSAQDERTLQTAVNTDAGYAHLRAAKVQTSVDKGVAEMHVKEVDAAGKAQLQRTVFGDQALKAMNVRTVRLEKEAATIENTLKQRAEDNWERITTKTTDPEFDGNLRNLRLQETTAERALEDSKKEWTTLVENIVAEGASAPTITTQSDKTYAGQIKKHQENIEVSDRAIEAAKLKQKENLAEAFKASAEGAGDPELLIRAGGIGGDRAQTRIYAKAKDEVINAAVEEVKKTNRALTSEMTRFQLHKLMREGTMPDGKEATTEMRQAAMYALLEDKGNNQDANEIRDAIAHMGMMVDDHGNYYEALRDDDGFLILNEHGFAQIDTSKRITDKAEIGRRRDWQQFFDDAVKGTPHSLVTYSGTNKSEARAGTMVDDMRMAFVRDATGGKFSPEKMLKADIDELKTLVEDLNNPNGFYSRLDAEKQQQVKSTLESAILRLQGNENINAGIDDRNRGAMNDILAFVNPTEYAPEGNGRDDRRYIVDANKAIVPRSKMAEQTTAEFRAPVAIPGVHRPGSYYKEWDVDPNL